jgi:MFS family permease
MVLAALHLGAPRAERLKDATEQEWREALAFADRSQLTLELRRQLRGAMPDWVRERTDADAAKNQIRLGILRDLYRDLSARLSSAAVDFVALKGLTQCPDFGSEPESRVQYDVDLYVPPDLVQPARGVLLDCGFESITGMDDFPTDHLPAFIRKTGWQWRGDYFDPELPFAVELHFRFWNSSVERLPAGGTDEFWTRRVTRIIAGVRLPALCPPDALGYAALHLLRHLLRGSLRPLHALEVARFIARRAHDEAFWTCWRALHPPELRRLESVAFRLALEWFGGKAPEAVRDEWKMLPPATAVWFSEFARSPAHKTARPNKDELWLHLSLLSSNRDRWLVARRRLLPKRMPGPVDAVYVPHSTMTWRLRLRKRLRYGVYCAQRIRHHWITLPRTAVSGIRFWHRCTELGSEFWNFLAAAVIFNFGLFIFVLLYNLRLLDLGFREDFLGLLSGAGTAGTVAGVLPAAWILRRLGLRNALLGTFALGSLLVVLRALATGRYWLIGLSAAWGLVFAVWAVAFAPMIAAAVPGRKRATGFAIFFGAMFATGIAGDWIGGKLPGLLHGKQAPLLLSGAIASLALLPALRLQLHAPQDPAPKLYPRGRFLTRYLTAIGVWNIATGTFNPFANAYFASRHVRVDQIGALFSASQMAQAAAALLAPVIFRKAGLAGGIMYMMLATGCGLLALATQPTGAALAVSFLAYTVSQWMSEPGLTALLMNHCKEAEQGGAAALHHLASFSAQAAASTLAGWLLAQLGYGPVLGGAAVVAAIAGLLFGRLRGLTVLRNAPELPKSASGNDPE